MGRNPGYPRLIAVVKGKAGYPGLIAVVKRKTGYLAFIPVVLAREVDRTS